MANARLKVGLVIDTDLDATDGVQQYVLTLGSWLQASGHEVRYLAGQTHRQDLPGLYSLARNIRVRFNGNSLTIPLPAPRARIKQVLDKEKFDVLHVQTPHSPFMAQKVILTAQPTTAIFGTFHILPLGWLSRLGNKLLGIWLGPSLKRFGEIVSVSSAAAEFAQLSFGIRTAVIPNLIDLKPFQSARPLAKYADNVLTILFLGRLVPRKGCQTLLEAINLIRGRPGLPKFRVVICPSQGGESFGIVLIEAMASGNAVVLAGDNPGYRSVMRDRPELLFEPKNVQNLADLIAVNLLDSRLRQGHQDWAKQQVEQYDVKVVGQNILKHYDQALRKTRPA